jgi:glycosyltransferase involved in cell wall biosynthesis
VRLVFAIPTWNRANELFECVTSIAEQNPDAIYISDNCSNDQTAEICTILKNKYPCVTYTRLAEHVLAEENFKNVVSIAEGDYIWTFGDDDILLPGALNFARTLLGHNLDFYHVAEENRASTNSAKKDTLLNLCCDYGFLEMTGFMTGNITRAEKIKKACASKNWEIYTNSAFSHSLALLEVLAHSEAAFIDIPMIRAAVENEETVRRWQLEKTTSRYIYIAEGLLVLRDAGIIPAKLSETFFRYLQWSLLRRIMNDYLARTFNPETPVTKREWDCFENIVGLIEEPRGSILMEWFRQVRSACIEGLPVILDAFYTAGNIRAKANTIQLPEYPYTYLEGGS